MHAADAGSILALYDSLSLQGVIPKTEIILSTAGDSKTEKHTKWQ